MWQDIRHPKNPSRLLFRYDPERAIIQVQEKGEKFTIDLKEYQNVKVAEKNITQEAQQFRAR